MKRSLAIVCALLLICISVLPVFASASTYMYVKTANGKGLNMRSEPKLGQEYIMNTISYGTRVEVMEYVDANWALVTPTGWSNPAYCMRKYLVSKNPGKYVPANNTTEETGSFANFVHVEPYTATVTVGRAGGFANLRWAPAKTAALMEKIYPGSEVTVIAKSKYWYQVVDTSNNYTGFLYYTFLATK